jgi:hypothetical protein
MRLIESILTMAVMTVFAPAAYLVDKWRGGVEVKNMPYGGI